MGRRGIGHQQADERRGVTAPPAIRFRAALDARYQRTSIAWTRPVAAVLREPLRPIQIENRVDVDARALHVSGAAREHGVLTPQRSEPKRDATLTRIVERGRRDDMPSPSRARRAPDGAPPDERPVPANARGVMPGPPAVPMVLVRPAAAPAPLDAATSAAAGDWSNVSGGSPRAVRAEHWTTPDAALATVDVNRLTERVVAAIDRRMTAARERLGG
jgi:hypothetical protein